ncbi:hypothetical protein FOXB_05371 [Fusarium oxysporum f. sp. conglutinans Fo5176]|uniref:Saccharopine dehydrogenase NADP binding domain-containing protein n=3 Tax=Fusarium oxysporum f. sp. conglutinans TaxID=100902 RepID=F9FG42_FUSOF|nr:hypothetical protein FOXB_05371 [Fusarium oxysporum f. sp. conglutinans Fo5176]
MYLHLKCQRAITSIHQNTMGTRSHKITILGATGWTATICVKHIVKTFPTNTRWCIAGRSAAKLEALRQDLRANNPDRLEPETYVISQLDAEACACNGTHYVDLNTETAWIAEMIRDFNEVAKGSGAIIIPAISGSSAPSDLQGLPIASEIVCSGKLNMLGMQGGSLHTVLDVAETYGISGWLTSDTSVLLPYPKHVVKNKRLIGYRYDQHLGHLATSFVAWGNESVVQRSAALNPKIYGQNFVYKEYSPATGLISALLMHIVTKLGILLLAVPWFRSFVRGKSFDRGSGPDRDESHKIESAEWKAVGYVTGKKEPVAFAKFSYKGALVDMAAILAVEAAATINQMNKSEAIGAGLLTPSTLGITFVDRPRAAGFDLTVDGSESH